MGWRSGVSTWILISLILLVRLDSCAGEFSGEDEQEYTSEEKIALLTSPASSVDEDPLVKMAEGEAKARRILNEKNGAGEEGKIHVSDMLLREDQVEQLYGEGAFGISATVNRTRRTATQTNIWQWPGREIPYDFQYGHFNDRQQKLILEAMAVWEQHTCIKFRQISRRVRETTYVNIAYSEIFCEADVGFPGKGKQSRMRFRTDCLVFGQVLHELGHVLGMVHEHNLPNRDQYITIHPSNINANHENDFQKYAPGSILSYDNLYDLSSIMHIEHNLYAVNITDSVFSVPDKWAYPYIGKIYKRRLSYSDIKFINKFYKCDADCPLMFQNKACLAMGGYQTEHCSCHTASGFYRDYCVNTPAWDKECYDIAARGFCDPNNELQHKHCPKACMLCPRFMPGEIVPPVPPNTCRNIYPDGVRCSIWAMSGMCKQSRFIRRYCHRSCQLCNDPRHQSCPNIIRDINCDSIAAKIACKLKLPSGEVARNLCQSSCNSCNYKTQGKCENQLDDDWCSKRALLGECDTKPLTMYSECASACNRCWFNNGECENKVPQKKCELWAVRNRCFSGEYSSQMEIRCAKTCDTCSIAMWASG